MVKMIAKKWRQFCQTLAAMTQCGWGSRVRDGWHRLTVVEVVALCCNVHTFQRLRRNPLYKLQRIIYFFSLLKLKSDHGRPYRRTWLSTISTNSIAFWGLCRIPIGIERHTTWHNNPAKLHAGPEVQSDLLWLWASCVKTVADVIVAKVPWLPWPVFWHGRFISWGYIFSLPNKHGSIKSTSKWPPCSNQFQTHVHQRR